MSIRSTASTSIRCSLAVTIAVGAVLLSFAPACAEDARLFYAARCTVSAGGTWGIHERDGANRPTEPYLSSLVGGEAQTGSIGSPPFKVAVDTVRFTIRGHDGQGGGRNQNYLALLDNKTGEILRKTPAPGNDVLQECQWDVADLRGRTVRLEATDGNRDGAFAWMGIGRIEAGPEMTIDFRQGLPANWRTSAALPDQQQRPRIAVEESPVPFLAYGDSYTWIPEQGIARVRLGVKVKRLFLLGCTVPANRVLETYGFVDIVYADGSKESYPLVYGFTLEGVYKTASHYDGSHVLPVGDGAQTLLAIRPGDAVIQQIELRRAADHLPRPRISAITCELDVPPPGAGANAVAGAAIVLLIPLESVAARAADLEWIAAHTLSADGPTWQDHADEIRRQRGEPVTLRDVQDREQPPTARFERRKISDQAFEAASVCDVDQDGNKDIVSGNFWYAGPDFSNAYRFRSLELVSGYHDSFSDYPLDVNGDSYIDIVSGGWFGKTLLWCENPGGQNPDGPRVSGDWTVHEIDTTGSIETTRFWDVDGDGCVEAVPNAGGNVVFYRLLCDAAGRGSGRFEKHNVKLGGCGHGLGFGDINGDGRGDFITPGGWLEAPRDPLVGEWPNHEEFTLDRASVPILVHDVDADGSADLIYGDAHGYGLYWVQQGRDDDGNRTWTRHLIEDRGSQYHDMQLADVDGDGVVELVTGKRYHAHNGHDPGAEDPVFVRYFEIDRNGDFTPHTIDFGPADQASGVGIYFWAEDVDGDGQVDIVAPGKEGLYLFLNKASP